MSKVREHKVQVSPAIVTKVDAEKGIVEAIVNVYGILDLGNDISVNGMCAKTISERGRDFKVLNSHNTYSALNVIGLCLAAREVGRDELPEKVRNDYPEATGGLWTQTQYLIDTPEGKGVFDRIKVGAVTEFSIGYETIQSEYKKIDWRGEIVNARFLKEIKLYEYSPVVFGMNQATAVTGVKTDGAAEPEKGKTMTDNKGFGSQPQPNMGDYLSAKMRRAVNQEADFSLMCGEMTAVEHKAVSDALHTGVEAFVKALPETVAAAPRINGGFMWFSADDPDGQKRLAKLQGKAGRVLSSGNAATIQGVIDGIEGQLELLEQLLADAGVVDPADDEPESPEDASATDKSKTEPQAGPDAVPPTDETRKRLLANVLSQLETIEVANGSHSGSDGSSHGQTG